MDIRSVRTALVAATAALSLSPGVARAFTTVNPGITLSYTFGRGFTYGLEVSVVGGRARSTP